jgi:rod shape-determining protein MreC
MNAVTATRRTIRREWTTFGALLIVSVGLMGVSGTKTAQDLESGVNWAVSPAETFINGAADTAGSYWSALTQIDRLASQNKQLTQENLTLQEELDRMASISQLDNDWTKITAEAQSVPYQTTPVQVIVRDISDVSQRNLIINKGSNDGLTEGEVAIDAGGAVVGRIESVDATVSKILLISDPSSFVVGKEVKTGATGTIQGTIGGQLEMSYVDVSATLTQGEPVVTAGEALPGTGDVSPYPPGLLIGTISSPPSQNRNAVVQSATVTPAAHLTDATFLLVITNFKGGFNALPSGCVYNPIPSGSGSPTPTPRATGSSGTSSSPSAGTGACPSGASRPTPSPSIKPSQGPTVPPTAKPQY